MLRCLSPRSCFLVAICSLIVSVSPAADELATIDVPLVDENLRQLVQDRDWEAATAAVDRALQQEGAQRDRLTYLKGRILHFQGQYDAAVAVFGELQKQYPELWQARLDDIVNVAPPAGESLQQLAERVARYRDLFENSQSIDGVAENVKNHLIRMSEQGEGAGIELIGNLNKDYLGAFHAPFSRDLENTDLAVIGMPLEKAAPMNASHKYGPSDLRKLSKNGMGTTEPWDGGFDVPFDLCRISDYGNIDTYAGAQKKLDMYLGPDSKISLRFYLKTHLAVEYFKVRLACGKHGKADDGSYEKPKRLLNRGINL